MACDPWTLAVELACWRCFNPVLEEGVTLALLEEIDEQDEKDGDDE